MRVVLDTRNVSHAGGTGIATYVKTLAAACAHANLQVSWLGGTSNCPTGRSAALTRFCRSLRSRRMVKSVAHDYEVDELYRTAVSRYRKFSKITTLEHDAPPAIMHWTCPLPLHWRGARNVVTIHDLIPFLRPDLATTVYKDIGRFLREACNHADAIVTISEAVKADIVDHLNVPASKVHNLSQAVEFDEKMLEKAQNAEAEFTPGSFLYFGTLERRKNIVRLIRAHGKSHTKRPLILIGALGVGGAEITAEVERHPAPDRVKIVPWAHREVLVRGIQDARAVVFPSLAEGFGLPIIEAMLLGTPVMTSCEHATGEIAGGAALTVDPHSVEDMALCLRRLDYDNDLVEHLRLLGLDRSKDFSIAGYSSRMSAFYRSVASA